MSPLYNYSADEAALRTAVVTPDGHTGTFDNPTVLYSADISTDDIPARSVLVTLDRVGIESMADEYLGTAKVVRNNFHIMIAGAASMVSMASLWSTFDKAHQALLARGWEFVDCEMETRQVAKVDTLAITAQYDVIKP